MSTSVLGKGSVLKVTISATPTVIPNLTKVSGIPAKGVKIPSTALSDGTEQVQAGIPDLGDYQFEGNFDPTDTVHVYLAASQKAAVVNETWTHTYGITAGVVSTKTNTFVGPLIDFAVGSVDKAGLYPFVGSVHVNSNTAA